MERMIKSAIKSLIRRSGYQVVAGTRRISMKQTLAHMKLLGLDPETVVDVGVGYGTPELYESFPEASYILVEPVREFEPQLRRITQRVRGKYVVAAAGAAVGAATINVHTAGMQGSSFFHEADGPEADGTPRTVPVVRIDDLHASGRTLIKLDTQGAELLALSGAGETLKRTDAVLMEVSVMGCLVGMPLLADVLDFMGQRGFVAYDFFGGDYRPLDGALSQIDVVFVQEDGMFRRDRAYTRAQRHPTEEHDRRAFAWR